jgi:hypothetical protein
VQVVEHQQPRACSCEEAKQLRDGVEGAASFANTLGYWRAIAEALERQPAQELLLVDELVGPPLTAEDWAALVVAVGPRLGNLRIAHVKPHGLEAVEHCVLSAIGAGLMAQVFEDEQRASVWLRYGAGEV